MAIATAGIEFGGSVGKLSWGVVSDQRAVSAAEADRYTKLAERVRMQVDIGRSTSRVVITNFNVAATTLGYYAATSPEPLSKAVAGLAAWGAKKSGDALGAAVLDAAEDQARAVLAEGLKESGIPSTELQTMTAQQLPPQ